MGIGAETILGLLLICVVFLVLIACLIMMAWGFTRPRR